MATMERYSRTIPANGIIELMRGNVLLLISATAAVNLRLENGGAAEGISGVIGGVRIERVKPWENARIVGTAGVTVEFWVGAQNVEKDVIDVIAQIATIAGVVPVSLASSAFTVNTAESVLATATSVDIAANALRKRLTIQASSGNTGSLWIRDQAATTNGGIELQGGQAVVLDTTAAMRIRNNSGANQSYSISEET